MTIQPKRKTTKEAAAEVPGPQSAPVALWFGKSTAGNHFS
jgi:hypothetical protein